MATHAIPTEKNFYQEKKDAIFSFMQPLLETLERQREMGEEWAQDEDLASELATSIENIKQYLEELDKDTSELEADEILSQLNTALMKIQVVHNLTEYRGSAAVLIFLTRLTPAGCQYISEKIPDLELLDVVGWQEQSFVNLQEIKLNKSKLPQKKHVNELVQVPENLGDFFKKLNILKLRENKHLDQWPDWSKFTQLYQLYLEGMIFSAFPRIPSNIRQLEMTYPGNERIFPAEALEFLAQNSGLGLYLLGYPGERGTKQIKNVEEYNRFYAECAASIGAPEAVLKESLSLGPS